MIYRILFSLLAFLELSTYTLAAGVSKTTNGVYLVIDGRRHAASVPKTNSPIQFDDPLVFKPFCDTTKMELAYPVDPAFGVNIKMTDATGREVHKTNIGKRFGSKFRKLHNFNDTRLYPYDTASSYNDESGLGSARPFSNYPLSADNWLAPKDLFEMKGPGIYTLEIQMQMFYDNPQSTNAWHEDLLQFPPVKIEVEMPPSKKSNKP